MAAAWRQVAASCNRSRRAGSWRRGSTAKQQRGSKILGADLRLLWRQLPDRRRVPTGPNRSCSCHAGYDWLDTSRPRQCAAESCAHWRHDEAASSGPIRLRPRGCGRVWADRSVASGVARTSRRPRFAPLGWCRPLQHPQRWRDLYYRCCAGCLQRQDHGCDCQLPGSTWRSSGRPGASACAYDGYISDTSSSRHQLDCSRCKPSWSRSDVR